MKQGKTSGAHVPTLMQSAASVLSALTACSALAEALNLSAYRTDAHQAIVLDALQSCSEAVQSWGFSHEQAALVLDMLHELLVQVAGRAGAVCWL